MRYLNNDQIVTKMSFRNKPAIYIEEKEHLIIRTSDCFHGRLQKEEDLINIRMG